MVIQVVCRFLHIACFAHKCLLQDIRIDLPLAVDLDSTGGRMLGTPSPLCGSVTRGGLVVLESNSQLLSGPVVPIHFFRSLFLKQLVPRHVLLDLVIRHDRLRRLERR
jgi:hypothetical protein